MELEKALKAANIKISQYDPSKYRPVKCSISTCTIEKFSKILSEKLRSDIVKFPEVAKAIFEESEMARLIEEYSKAIKVYVDPDKKVDIEIPPDMENLTLNMNLSAKSKDDKFFLTHPDETISEVTGEIYLMINQISPLEAAAVARKVIPEYLPRSEAGVSELTVGGKPRTVFNTYTPPEWTTVNMDKVYAEHLPILFKKLVKHLFPLAKERDFFLKWLYHSLFKRSYTFLVLCGAPGTGKNRLKLVLRALHGHVNTVDGKKSTLVERFNSQLSEATLAWFDELHYDMEMENVMKELQNDTISIERKGVDATKGTRIYSSIVISNNKPRDNYIAFDARKFAPLVVRNERLETSMTLEEIDELTRKVEDEKSPDFDPMFLAQIVKWIQKYGDDKRWPNLEYRGPMFWSLAHTSMSKWQKKIISHMISDEVRSPKWGYDFVKTRFLWSEFNSRMAKRGNQKDASLPDFTTVRSFFEAFRDGTGKKSFTTEEVQGNNILGDFYVSVPSKDFKVISESELMKGNKNGKEDFKEKKK